MPTYEYECLGCGRTFERFQSINDEPLRECSDCGDSVRRLISTGGGLVFRGPGFYATDYRKGPGPSTTEKEKKESAGAEAGSEPKEAKGDDGE
jgi:putative FmdB family regulatory protein